MLTPSEISSSVELSLKEGHSLAIVTLMEQDGKTPERAARLLVGENGKSIRGTLGDRFLDEIAVRYAFELIADDKQEITVATIEELVTAMADEAGEVRARFAGVRLLFEISRPPLGLIICGGGHVGQAIARAARLIDFNVTVIDDRADFASREKFPDWNVHLISNDFVQALSSIQITQASHIVIVTRGHRHDEMCLREVIARPARYIGMIGSRRRTTTIRERLKREGIEPELLRRVHSPIGLDIGAQTPEEIALAILAEIILVRRGGTGKPKSFDGPMARSR